MPSRIDLRSATSNRPEVLCVPRGESQALKLEGESFLPVMIMCDSLDLKTAIYLACEEDGSLSQLLSSPQKPEEKVKSLIMELVAELKDNDPPIDIASLGVAVAEGRIVLSHFSTLFARN
jgi:hypothetical protein